MMSDFKKKLKRKLWDMRVKFMDWSRVKKHQYRKWRGTAGEEQTLEVHKMSISTNTIIQRAAQQRVIPDREVKDG